VHTKTEILRRFAINKAAQLVLLQLVLFAVLFIAFFAAAWIAEVTGRQSLGYLCVAAFLCSLPRGSVRSDASRTV
jgi:hypothetical protein